MSGTLAARFADLALAAPPDLPRHWHAWALALALAAHLSDAERGHLLRAGALEHAAALPAALDGAPWRLAAAVDPAMADLADELRPEDAADVPAVWGHWAYSITAAAHLTPTWRGLLLRGTARLLAEVARDEAAAHAAEATR
ncbi:hypothetical protein [Pseudactinotalea terrae]|uniref:hypothetical protein n=1 Tax=Pseudactinotalea terrae TaxID=1743262 RepID=UPI0012E0CF76|nr:hypothetical protein [Pseudactinotalea terrae]